MPSEIEKLQLEIEKLQSVISKNQRLWLTGSMMGNLIHDLNNPLTSINGNIELLLINPVVTNDPKLKKRIETVNQATKRLANKMRDMQLFTKEGRTDVILDINDICQETARVAEYLPKPFKLPIVLNLSSNALTSIGNPNQLAQAILMLLDNAIDSSLSKSTTTTTSTSSPKVTLSTSLSDTNQILIKISNTGPKIEDEVARRMFEPLFSTKGQLGMGLTIVRELVLAHSAQLTFTSSDEETEFIIALPSS
ncbi:MAG: HAMP domain-containing histidine kinase [Acidobacteria bacterium]|nr:HAMP domain-containing histidine kinase [Acidobacteriota bacterium]